MIYFRMAFNKSLNAACDLDGYLFCKMPAETLEVEIDLLCNVERMTPGNLNTTLYYKILELIYSILTLWYPDDMCYKMQELIFIYTVKS